MQPTAERLHAALAALTVTVEDASGRDRRVMQAMLTADRLEALLQALVDNGFFGWQDLYGDFSVTDLPTKCLDVTLTSASKSVCSYNNGGPVMYHNLYNEVVNAGGESGVEFVPGDGGGDAAGRYQRRIGRGRERAARQQPCRGEKKQRQASDAGRFHPSLPASLQPRDDDRRNMAPPPP